MEIEDLAGQSGAGSEQNGNECSITAGITHFYDDPGGLVRPGASKLTRRVDGKGP